MKPLNRAILADIASTAARERLYAIPSNVDEIAKLYMVDKQFSRAVLRALASYDLAVIQSNYVELARTHGRWYEVHFLLEPSLFAAICTHSGRVPTVRLECSPDKLGALNLRGIESLQLDGHFFQAVGEVERMVRIMEDNKCSLKFLRGVSQSILVHLPSGLHLDEISVRGVDANEVVIPAVDTKVFDYEIRGYRRLPLGYLRHLNADEVRVHFHRSSPRWSIQPSDTHEKEPTISYALTPANHRTKKLRFILKFWDEPVSDVDFPRIFSEVAVCCPNLERCEIQCDPYLGCSTYQKFTAAVDELVPVFERTLQEADMPYKVFLIAHLSYKQCNLRFRSVPNADDFKCGLVKADRPPTDEDYSEYECFDFVKEATFGNNSLRVECSATKSPPTSYDYEMYSEDSEGDMDESWS